MISWCILPHMRSILQCWKKFSNDYTKIISKSISRNVFLETKRSLIWVLHWHWKASNLDAANSKQSGMPNHQPQSRWWDLLLASATFSECTLRILLSLQCYCSRSLGRTQDTNQVSRCITCFQNPPTTDLRSSNGFPTGWSSIHPNYRCSNWYCRCSRRSWSNPYANGFWR